MPLPARDLGEGLVIFESVTVRSRLVGLAFMDELPAGHALHLTRCRSVHTAGMRFAIDVVFLDAAERPVRLAQALGAGEVRFCRTANSALEANAGEGARFARALSPRPPPAAAA